MTHTYRRALNQPEPFKMIEVGSFPKRKLWRLLREKLGPMRSIKWDKSPWCASDTITWNCLLHTGEVVGGTLAVKVISHAGNLAVGAELTVLTTAQQTLRSAGKLFTTRLEKIEITSSDGGIVTAQDVGRMIEPHVGPVFQLTFRKALNGLPNTVAWEAVDQDGDLLWGSLVLRAKVSDSQVVSWAELQIDKPVGFDFRKHASSGRDTQLENIARMARQLIRKLHDRPRVATPDLLTALVAIVDEAEAETPTGNAERVAARFVREAHDLLR